MSKNWPHPQNTTSDSDLFNVTPKRNEMHQLMQQLDLPNESLTLSQLSQSPFNVKARREFGNTKTGTYNDKNSDSNSDNNGKSDYQSRLFHGRNANNIGHKNDKNAQAYTTDENMQEDEDYNGIGARGGTYDYQQDPSPRFDDYSNQNVEEQDDYSDYSNNGKSQGVQKRNINNRDYSKADKSAHHHIDTADEDEINDYYHSKISYRDISPDFTGHSNNEDLTVSQNNVSQMKVGGAQNRTFADSVINHRLLTEPGSNNKNNGKGQYNKRKVNETTALSNNDVYNRQYEDDDECINERDEESKEEVVESASDISGLNSFTQTQYSKHSKLGGKGIKSKPATQFRQIKAPSVDITEDNMVTKRSPNVGSRYQNMDHDSSLELTPESNSSKYLLSTSKSGMTSKQMVTNRTIGSDLSNPKNQNNLKQRPGSQNKTLSKDANFPLAGGKHNISINRDHELESALVEGSNKQMVRTGSVDQMAAPQQRNQDHSASSEFQSLKHKISLLNIENQKHKVEMSDLRQLLDEKEHQLFNCHGQIQSVQNEFENCRNHLDLLKVKTKDDSKLNALRGKQLTTAVKNYQQAQKVIQQKDYDIQQLYNQLHEKNGGQKAYEIVVNQELKKLTSEIDSLRIINERMKKDKIEQGENETHLQKKFKLDFEKAKQQNNMQLQQLEVELKKLQILVTEKEQQLQTCYSDLKELDSIVEQKEKFIENEGYEKSKLQIELKKVKERCDEQEKELNQFKQYDNSTLFGNSINMGYGVNNLNQASKNSNDLEIRQMKEVFQQKLTKAQADATKWKNQSKDLEIKVAKLEEEGKKRLMESRSQQSSKIEQDQELLKEIRRLQQQYDLYMELQNDIRICFELSEDDDIMGKMQELKNMQEENQILQEDKQLISEQYENVKREFQEAISKINNQQQTKQPSSDNMSQFTKNLLLQKEKDIEKLKEQLRNINEQLQAANQQIGIHNGQYQTTQSELREIQEQLENSLKIQERTNDAKQKAEQNVENLKDQLRTLMRTKEEEPSQSTFKEKMNQQVIDELKKKNQQMIQTILQLDLAPDPLAQANFSLQNSFIDEFEQALKHLNDQEKLSKDLINQLKQSQSTLTSSLQELEGQYSEKVQKLNSYEKEINIINEQLFKKDQQLNINMLEHQTLVDQNGKLQEALKSVEQSNIKLKEDNDSLNNDLRKLRRSQEHLYKGPKKSGEDKNQESNEVLQQQEMDKMAKTYDEKIRELKKSNELLSSQIESLKFEIEQQHQQPQYDDIDNQKRDFLEQLDQIIDGDINIYQSDEFSSQITQRIDKIRKQEKLKIIAAGQTNNQEGFENDQEQELAQSVAKWLKQSQGGQQRLQNFFKGEDNSSMLMINELMSQQQVRDENQNNLTYHLKSDLEMEGLKSEILVLKQSIEENEAIINDLQNNLQQIQNKHKQELDQVNAENLQKEEQWQHNIESLNSKIQEQKQSLQEKQDFIQTVNDQLKQKEASINQLQEQLQHKQQQFEVSQKQNKQHFELEIDNLKASIRQEFIEKTQKLDSEYEELEKSRIKMREEFERQNKETELKYKKRIEEQEKEFRDKLLQMERDVKNGCEKNKDEVVGNIYKEMEEQYNSKVKILKEEHIALVSQLKQESQKQLEEAKRIKDREIKRIKEENERAKKSLEEKIKKLSQDLISEKDSCEADFKSKLDEVLLKHKKDIKTSQDKVRAEMRNQIDNVKNDCIKQKAEWERDRKKQFNDYQLQMEQNTRELEEQFEQQLKAQKDQSEKLLKKKLEDKEKNHKEKLDEYEFEIQQINEAYKEGQKKEKDRLENRLREQMKIEIETEIREEVEAEFSEQLEAIQLKFQKDLDLIRQKYEQVLEEERNSQKSIFPKSMRNVETQCVTGNMGYHSDRTHQSVNQSISSNTIQNSNTIDRVEYGYKKELERQQQVFELQLIQKQQITVRIFEELFNLECKKILDSIYYKSGPQANTKELDNKRKEVNTLINDILNRNDDRQEKQMKISLDNIKVKICDVLRLYKESLEAKMAKNQTQISQQRPNMNQVRHSINGAIELPHNISKVSMSNVEYKSDYGESDMPSLAPTPKMKNASKNERSIQIKKEFEQYLNDHSSDKKNKHSDVKRYIEYNEEPDHVNPENILKKVTPLPNQKGVMMVEVDKVVRDVKMLQQTIRQSKFYRVLMPIGDQLQQEDDNSDRQEIVQNDENTAQAYRQLLNDLMKIIVKLNKGVDQIGKQQEVYKLKLLNVELKEQLTKMQKDQLGAKKQIKAEEIIQYYGSRINNLTEEGQECLNRLEQTQFQINKLQFSLYQLCDLFTLSNEIKGIESLNSNNFEVSNKCKEYIKQYPHDDLNENNKLLSSQYSPEQKKISPEMLSPEETAQLIANVFQNLNSAQTKIYDTTSQSNNNYNNNQLDTYQSFFNTFLSNDEYKRSAENFIKQFNECSKLDQTAKSGIPLQRSTENLANSRYQRQSINNANIHGIQNQRYHTDIPLQMKDKRRSNSHTMQQSNNSYCLPPQYVSNVFQSNVLDNNKSIQSHHPHQHGALYDTHQSQTSFFNSHQNQPDQQQYQNYNGMLAQPVPHNFYNQQHHNSATQLPTNASLIHNGSVSGFPTTSQENVNNAQHNVNSLFNQLKLNLNVPQMQQDSFH